MSTDHNNEPPLNETVTNETPTSGAPSLIEIPLDETQEEIASLKNVPDEMEDKTPNHDIEHQLEIIAELAMTAQTAEIKDVLYAYDPKASKAKTETTFSSFRKQHLTDTLEFLGVNKIWKNYKVSSCAMDLVERIQNLLPEQCNYCNEQYTINANDQIILPCSTCNQEPHRSCLARRLSLDASTLTRDIVHKTINPLNLRELLYLCPTCIDRNFPITEGMTAAAKKAATTSSSNPQSKRKQQKSVALQDTNININSSPDWVATDDMDFGKIHSSQTPSSSAADTDPVSQESPEDTNSQTPAAPAPTHTAKGTKTNSKQPLPPRAEDEKEKQKKQTCKHYRLGTCKHGLSGKRQGTCTFDHPKLCPKLMRNGTRKKYGCNLGKECKNFHPKVCFTSLTKRFCYDLECPDWHIKGTARTQPEKDPILENPNPPLHLHKVKDKETTIDAPLPQAPQSKVADNSGKDTTQPQQQEQQPFLGMIHCLQESQKAVEAQLNSIFQMLSNLQPQQQPQQQPMMRPAAIPAQNLYPQQYTYLQAAKQPTSAMPTFMV